MPTMEQSALPRYATVSETAAVCGVNERRVRNWQNLGLLKPALSVGRIQFHRADVVRCSILLQLQSVLGQDSPLATEIALALSHEQIEALLHADDPAVVLDHGRRSVIGLDPEDLEQIRERLASIPR